MDPLSSSGLQGHKIIHYWHDNYPQFPTSSGERRPTVGNSERTVTNSIGTVHYNTKVCALRR
jgi:hypothetical protein